MEENHKKLLRALAIYLPQFHPIPENDKWWGKGFTEWRNVVKGKPILKGQYQPHLPADLGFYDLRLPEIREQQAEMARKYGIYGFCYYHYWFNGKLMLEKPLQEVIKTEKPDFPFCICWANENWSRRWDGDDKEILMEQNYSEMDHRKHIEYLCQNIFNDSRYITIDSKPVFIVYAPDLIPDLDESIDIWNEIAMAYGFKGLYVICFLKWNTSARCLDIKNINALAEFSPFLKTGKVQRSLLDKIIVKMGFPMTARQKNKIIAYTDLVDNVDKKYQSNGKLIYPCVTPMWDNYVRRRNGNAGIYIGSTPSLYGKWLEFSCREFVPPNNFENFIFINAWNEWAEGNHLEPCEKWGHSYLESTHSVLNKYK